MKKLIVLTIVTLACIASPAQAQPFPSLPGYGGGYFTTPPHKTVCRVATYTHGPNITCTIPSKLAHDADGELGHPQWEVWWNGTASRYVIIGDPPEAAYLRRIRYGVTYNYRHRIKCRVSKTRGIKCWNRAGHGFRVSVQSQEVF